MSRDDTAALAAVLGRHDYAYLLTQPADKAPHAVPVVPRLDDGTLVIDDVGRRSLANASARPLLSLVWPPRAVGDYSLIVDGTGEVGENDTIRITPTRAVQHRRGAPEGATGACASDCIEIPLGH